MKRNNIFYYLGNLFILISLLGFAYTVYPVIKIHLFPTPPPAKAEIAVEGFFLSIPKIHAYSKVIENVDPWTESVYQRALKLGVAHAKGTKLPGEKGTVFLFAHSSGSPWQVTHTNTVFLRLGELIKADSIYIDYQGKRYTYRVINKLEVWPQETKYINSIDENMLILQTCTPLGTSLKRLLIFAKLQTY